MYDLLLVSPRNIQLGRFKRFVPRSVPIGVGILAGFLREKGLSVKILDREIVELNTDTLADCLKQCKKPHIVGISVMTANVANGYQIAEKVKSIDKEAKVIFGGIHATVMPEEILRQGNVDFAISGEGEYALLELIRQIKDNSLEPDRLENVGFLEDGQVVYTKPSTKMMDVNALPMFPYDMFNPEHYDLGFILTSRGCPFDCIFCSQRAITKRVYRYVSSERVIEELGYLINEMKRPSVAFFDDYFTGNRERVLELCTLIQERGFHRRASFGVQTRGDSIDKELMVAMRAANFTSLMFGVETASEDLMKLINKKETVQENIDAIRLAKELGFEADATFIFGFPTETFEDRLAALSLAVENGIDRARFNNVVPYPGTQLFKTVKEQLKIAPQWANFSADRAATASIRKKYPLPFVPEGCSEEELEGSIFLANLLFYLNFNKLKKLFNPGEGASGKWFGVSWRELLSPGVVFSLLMLAGTVLLRTFYYLLTDRNCLRFFLKGLRVCLNPGQFSNSRKPTVGTEGYSKNF